MQSLQDAVDEAAERTGFSGVVRLDRAGETELSAAYGFADRAHGVPNTVETQFATASGTKTLTALAVMSLVERGALTLGTTARSLLGTDLPMIADDVTIEQLLAHRSGIGDYLDEDAGHQMDDYVMPGPVHTLADSNDYQPMLDGHRQSFDPYARFAYNNAGFVGWPSSPNGPPGLRSSTWCSSGSAARPPRHRLSAVRSAARTDRAQLPRRRWRP